MSYAIKRIMEAVEDSVVTCLTFAVCFHDGNTGITREVLLSGDELVAYQADRAAFIKARAIQEAVDMEPPAVAEAVWVPVSDCQVTITPEEVEAART